MRPCPREPGAHRGSRRGRIGARRASRPRMDVRRSRDEHGSAVVEFVFLGVLLLVPVVYLVLTVGRLQGGSFAVVGAADQAAKVYVDAPTPEDADARAREAVRVALADFGFSAEQAAVDIACDAACLAPGSTVTVVVSLDVPLPLIPALAGTHASAATVDAAATQLVERFG
jgi:Flp pilus assembly protein TadG